MLFDQIWTWIHAQTKIFINQPTFSAKSSSKWTYEIQAWTRVPLKKKKNLSLNYGFKLDPSSS
jgi:hypothetical protein